jgi:hypothetical protein
MIRVSIFLSGAAIIAIGMVAVSQLERELGIPLLQGALTLGGGLIICGLFTFRMLWHGVMGAGLLALLGLGRGVLNFPDAVKYITGERARGQTPILELAVTVTCAFLLMRILGAWKRERTRRLLEE